METKLTSVRTTKEIIEKYGFKLSKSLGQNFLINETILDTIIEAGKINKEDVVIEIGTGIGTLTNKLCENAGQVVAIEIDQKLLPILQETVGFHQNLSIINKDILKTDIIEELQQLGITKKVKVIANLPYYITTPIIMKFLEEKVPIDSMVLMMQKEVAKRIHAKPSTKEYGSLSVAVQYYCDTQIVCNVARSSFIPPPNVDSCVLKLIKRDTARVSVEREDVFFTFVKGSFSKRRKTILNSLEGYADLGDKEKIKSALALAGIDARRRGESLSIEEFARLANTYIKM